MIKIPLTPRPNNPFVPNFDEIIKKEGAGSFRRAGWSVDVLPVLIRCQYSFGMLDKAVRDRSVVDMGF